MFAFAGVAERSVFIQTDIFAAEGDDLVFAEQTACQSIPVAFEQFVRGEVGADDGGLAAVHARIDEVVKIGIRMLGLHLCAEVIKQKKVAGEVFFTAELFLGLALELVVIEVKDNVVRCVVEYAVTVFDDRARDGGGKMSLAQSRAADQQKTLRACTEGIGVVAQKLQIAFHECQLLTAEAVE